jgi:hypothetical protein
MLKFIVAGTGRCGTAYIAQVLTHLGVPCGHEWVYAPEKCYTDIDILGDSSAQAVPFIPQFDGLVLHQTRDPLKVIGSLVSFKLFDNPQFHGPAGEFIARHFHMTGNVLEDSMRYYVEWNERCEAARNYFRYRIEDLDFQLLRSIVDRIGVDVDDRRIVAALDRVPKNVNTRYSAKALSWRDLPKGRIKNDLINISKRYGYATEDSAQIHAA